MRGNGGNNPFLRHQAQMQTRECHDPQFQILCPNCKGENFVPSVKFFRTPGAVIGTFDVTMEQTNLCVKCGMVIDILKDKVRSELNLEEKSTCSSGE